MEARGHLRLDPGPGPQEDVQVQGQRDCPHRCARGIRLRRRALLGGLGQARRGHRLRDRADEDRPPPGHQAAQRLQVRAEPGRHRGLCGLRRPVRARATPWTGPCWPSSPTSSSRPPRRSRATTTPGPCRSPRASSGTSPTTTWSSSRTAPTVPPARSSRRPCWPPWRPAWTPCCASSRRSCRSPRRKSGAGGAPVRCTAPHGRPPSAIDGDTTLLATVGDRPQRHPQGQVRGQGQAAHRGALRDHHGLGGPHHPAEGRPGRPQGCGQRP